MRSADVHAVGQRGIRRDLVDVRKRGEMNNRIAAFERRDDRIAIAEIAQDRLDVPGAMMRRRDEIEVPRLDPPRQEPVHHMGSDEPGAAGHEHPHSVSSSDVDSSRDSGR